MSALRRDGEDLLLELRVQPRARRDGFGDQVDGRLRLLITAPPVDGKANAHITRLLGKLFQVPRSAVVIERGETSRDKRVRIRAPRRLPAEIAALLDAP